MSEETTYQEDCKIDENDLDQEWQKQPVLMGKWAGKLADATFRKMRAQQRYKVLKADAKWAIEQERADVDLDIRTYPQDYGLPEKPAERAIVQAINRDKKFRLFVKKKEEEVAEAYEKYLDWVQAEELYSAAVKAMTDRKKALENLQDLYFAQYYGEPRRSRFSSDARLERANETGRQLKEQMRGK